MVDQLAVLSPLNGSVNAKVFFLAEAPGRFGAGRTGIPFSGDRSSENFEELLAHIGLKRKEVFITNAVLCNPLANGNNSRPTSAEINNCSNFLQETLDLVRPNIVVTLGSVGLDALNRLTGTKLKLKDVVAKPQFSDKFIHLPCYHPSPRVTNWQRTMTQQKRDFRKILDLLKSKKKIKSQLV
jgi:DNA polymerase